jgi:hypothetical protein
MFTETNIVMYERNLQQIHTSKGEIINVPLVISNAADTHPNCLDFIEQWAKHFGLIGGNVSVAEVN